jgi:hypothetical protein
MARTNYSYEKRGRELEKQKKQEEKRQKKLTKKNEEEEKAPSFTDKSPSEA